MVLAGLATIAGTAGVGVDWRAVRLMHFLDGLVASIGLLGLTLALVGLYAVVAYQVARRTREIGIRMALGADRPQVMRLILKQAAAMALTGCVDVNSANAELLAD